MSRKEDFMKEYDQYVITSYGKPFPSIIIVEGKDVYVTDIEGKKYLDFWAGISVVTIGHRNPKVQEAVRNRWTS